MQSLGVYAGVTLAAATLAYSQTRNPTELDPNYDFNQQSIEIDPVEHVRIATTMKNRKLVTRRFEDVRTMYDVLQKGLQISNNGLCLGHRVDGKGQYVWITYSQVIERTRLIGSGLLNSGIKAENQTNVAIYSKNRPEWTIAEYACYSFSMNVVSLYDSYGKDSIKYIMNQAEISTVFVDNNARLLTILNIIDDLPFLRLVVHFDEKDHAEHLESIKVPERLIIISWSNLMKIGQSNVQSLMPPKPSDNATICYTSGTTGNPKGAMITHANLIANEAALYERLHKPHLKVLGASALSPSPVGMSYLPLAHMMERMGTVLLFLQGGRIGYISGDISTLLDDCKVLRPTNIPMVPRLLNKLYDRVTGEIGNSKIKAYLLMKAVESKEFDRKRGIIRRNTVYDKLMFNKIRLLFGGHVIRTATGSAPITKEVYEFSRSMFSCPIPEGFGQTEATCSITMCHALEPDIGHCGPPTEAVMVKLVDVPAMEYFAKDGKGEICAKGPSIFKGYFKDDEKTAEVIDQDGWLHTGDIGMWLPNGCLKIIDRIKHLFKLSQGEYISPEIFIDGNPLKDYIVAVVVPEQDYLIEYARVNGIAGSFKQLCSNEIIRNTIMNDLKVIGDKSGLMSYEKIRNIHLHHEPFTLENNLATPTLKLKRISLRQYFKDSIDKLYAKSSVKTSKL